MRILNTTVSEQVSKPNSGVPPFGHSTQLPVCVNSDSLQCDGVDEFVWATARTWSDVLPIVPNDLVSASGVVVPT
jgi:prolyl-tRNA editing enzyme YbaK/EbsC (Cys-tRNA(Pro) deacylase)